MIKKLLYTFSFFYFSFLSGQEIIETTVITFDLSEPSQNSIMNSNSKKIPRLVVPTESPLAIRLTGGNPFRYKYLLNYKLVNQYEAIQYDPLDSLQNRFKRISKTDPIVKDSLIDNNNLKKIELNLKRLNRDFDKIEKSIKTYKSSLILYDDLNLEKYKKQILNYKKSFESGLLEFTRIIQIYDQLEFDGIEQPETTLYEENEYRQEQDIEENRPDLSDEPRTSYLRGREEDRENPNRFYNSVVSSGFETFNIDSLKDSIEDKIKKINVILIELMSVKTDYYTLPIDLNGQNIDYVEFLIQRFEINSSTPYDSYSPKVWIRGGLKFDVSAGIFITNLSDKQYLLIDDPSSDSGNKIIKERSLGDFDYGIGSMLNLSLRGGSWVRPGISLGLSFSENQSFQGLAGINIILGKSQRWVFHYGLSMGSIKELASGFKVNESRNYDFTTSESIPIDEKFSFGQFFGFTYNFKILESKDKSLFRK
ncbi:hypothetical protein D1818_10870 [Aquimarina sp. BL5]|uniref:hypothetical protein n=1 Tax=Aquimarina sp. BL5 TaxID=1714860 RepID=UPI000E482CC9|nr:hypothetical protein [Aquimarina sp. BL5]AXT51307.1 hypothetical protein D1818_10870 [Aquimarina sp. BL5]RKM91386.1 hypothetical protein D7036_23310 [Aquimarina sp. BL5]